ncbi:hypothetical protein E8E12_006011 [Didymella heteroderae]|uniref:Uncharacterized protein n=1 Tax=Didymella heteroderae TaxID=1769908 RepID=A0A9P5C2G0_9PLEO|nr:hypothetical protein E8E12_006011 [Didymella heteroderae]
MSGWNFATAAYTDFPLRHPGVTSIEERVDGPWSSEEGEPVSGRLPSTALPHLRVLEKAYTTTHSLRDYFDTAANRPIKQELFDIAKLPTAQKNLCTLDFRGEISCWRRREKEESSEDENDDETREERDHRHQREERTFQEREKTRLPAILRSVLPYLTNLETLSNEMDSSNGTYSSKSNGVTYLEPMDRCDFYAILDLLPKKKEGKLKVLRLKDSRAAADPRAGRIREWVSEMNHDTEHGQAIQGSLRVLEWCGQKSSVIELCV